MGRGNFFSGDLIEVAAAPPREWRPRQLDDSGILPSLTGRLLISFQTEVRPTFGLAVGYRTAVAREAGYWLVARLESISQALPEQLAQNIPQRACRSLQRTFAKLFVLPTPLLKDSTSGRRLLAGSQGFRFEATRRVFTFEDQDARENRLICHVLAAREHRTTDRLLVEFVTAIREGQEPAEIRCEDDSGLCLWSKPSGTLAGKIYREVVIAPPEVMPKAKYPPADIDLGTEQPAVDEPPVKPLHEIGTPKASKAPSEGAIYDAFDKRLYQRSEADWKFVAEKIAEAQEEARPLDDDFVETVARQRLEYAQSYSYSDRPDAGPTLQSSIGIARSIVQLHLTALEHYKTEESS
jgi:hypothetical protein